MTDLSILILSVGLVLICIILAILWLGNKYIKYKYSELKLKERKLLYKHITSEKDFGILNDLIVEAIQEYQIFKLETDKYAYVTPKVQKDMFSYVVRKVLYRISPTYKEQLEFMYNKENFDEIITNKINIAIIDFSIEFNSNINTEEQKNKRDNL